MPVQQHYVPRLDQPSVYAFLRSPNQDYAEPVPVRPGWSPHQNMKDVGPVPTTRLVWAVRTSYQVLEGKGQGQVVGNFSIDVPWHQDVRLTIKSRLWLANGIDAGVAQRIRTSFDAYQHPSSGPIDEYVVKTLAGDPTIKRDMFDVDCTFIAQKTGPAVEHGEQRDAILATYKKGGPGEFYPGPGLKPVKEGYLESRSLRLVKLGEMVIDGPPQQTKDPTHEVEGTNPADIIEKIVKEENKQDCDNAGFDKGQWPIATLIKYPEFMVEWRDFVYEIGCGVRIIVRLPVLMWRETAVNLWAYSYAPKDVGEYVLEVVKTCTWHAALTGAVIGVVFGNLPAALAVFRGVFAACIESSLKQLIKCMIPGLALVTAPGQWKDV